MHYEKASAELITFVNGCFIITGSNTGSGESWDSSDEATNGFSRHYFAARNRH